MAIPAHKIYLRYKILCLQIFRIFWLHFCWLSYAHCRLSYVSLNSHAKFWSCHTNRKGRRGRVSCLDDVGQAIQPIVFTVKALVLMLCCGVAHWAMLSITPVIIINFLFCAAYLITEQSTNKIIDLVYHRQRLSLFRNKLERQYLECKFSYGRWYLEMKNR